MIISVGATTADSRTSKDTVSTSLPVHCYHRQETGPSRCINGETGGLADAPGIPGPGTITNNAEGLVDVRVPTCNPAS